MLPYNLAVYLDEASDDPIEACAVVARFGIRYVALRRLWTTPIAAAPDQACQKVAAAIREHNLQVIAVATECGKVPTAVLLDQLQSFKRATLIAAYFRAKFIRLFAGTGQRPPNAIVTKTAQDWLGVACAQAAAVALTPVLEVDPEVTHFTPEEVKALLDTQPGLFLTYDPALLMLRRAIDPLPYWNLKKRVAIVDLHDYHIGQSFRPIGHGDCRWGEIRSELLQAKHLWFILEPGLGRVYGKATTRPQTLALAMEALTVFWEGRQ